MDFQKNDVAEGQFHFPKDVMNLYIWEMPSLSRKTIELVFSTWGLTIVFLEQLLKISVLAAQQSHFPAVSQAQE